MLDPQGRVAQRTGDTVSLDGEAARPLVGVLGDDDGTRFAPTDQLGHRLINSSLYGVSFAGPGSFGNPSTRSPMMLRCTWSVPP